MKAAQFTSFGTPDVLRITTTDRPSPGHGEVLVRVEASSVNGHDTIVRRGGLKMVSGRRFPIGVGLDFAGTVAALGSGVQGYTTGDRVWGTVAPKGRHITASAAEYVLVAADRIGRTPQHLSSTDAASLVVAGATALTALRDIVALTAGEHVLVRGAAGGVGTAAVQLAHSLGARVTALAREKHAETLRELGADEVHDHTSTEAREIGPFDVILDTAGSQLGLYRSRLGKSGRMVTIALSGPAIAAIAASTIHRSRRIRTFSADPDTALLDDLADYVTRGALRPVVDMVYPLADIVSAHHGFEQGGVIGKHVISITA